MAIRAQLRALDRHLAATPWSLLRWSHDDWETGEPVEHFLLTCPACQRPPARQIVRLEAPEVISLSELEELE